MYPRVVARVLVIDDEAPIRLLCRINLEADGLEVLEASDGAAGLELAREQRPDVILLDLMLPTLSGWEVAEELVADERTSAIPIVLFTAHSEVGERARKLDIGGFAYLSKPFSPFDVAPLVRSVIATAESGEIDDQRVAKLAELRSLSRA